MIDRDLERRLAALEEFVSNCFSHRPGVHPTGEIQFCFVEDTDVSDQVDPEYLDYLKELTTRH